MNLITEGTTYNHFPIKLDSLHFLYSYAIALLDETHQPVKYLGPDDKIMTVKATVSPSAQFVLCIRTPEKSLLEVIASIKQNVS